MLGAVIGAGTALLGGAISNRANKRMAREQMAMQEDFAKHGVSWRVEDAKAAGLHPLAALGMQGLPAYSPVGVSDSIGPALAEAGQNIGRAVSATMTAPQRQLQALGLAAAEQALVEGDARIEALRSEAFRNYQEANAVKTFPVDDPFWSQFGASPAQEMVPESVRPVGAINPKAPDVIYHTAGDQSTMAGVTPIWRNFQVAPGITLALPGGVSGDAAEVLESLAESPMLMSAVIAHNANVNPAAGKWLRDLYTPQRSGSSWWRRPGEWLGGKLADLRDRAGARSYEERRVNQLRR